MYVNIRWSIFPYVIMYFVAFIIIGLMDITNAVFDPYRLFEAAYWQEVFFMTMGNVLILLATSDIYVAKILSELDDPNSELSKGEQGKRWANLQAQISLGLKALKDNFSLWLYKDNIAEKKHQYKINIYKKITRINKWSSTKSRRLYNQLKQAEVDGTVFTAPKHFGKIRTAWWFIFKKPRPNWYVKLRLKYEEMLTDKYIDERIEFMMLRYAKIKESFIRSGYNGSSQENERRIISKGRKFFNDHSPRIMLSTGIVAIMRAFLYNPSTFTVGVAFTIGVKVVVSLSNLIAGRNYAPRYFKEKIVRDESLRLSIITRYVADEVAEGGQTT